MHRGTCTADGTRDPESGFVVTVAIDACALDGAHRVTASAWRVEGDWRIAAKSAFTQPSPSLGYNGQAFPETG